MKDNIFVGRQEELKRLLELTEKKAASFIVIKGRRRIGKSRLIEEFSKYFNYYYKFEGLPPEKDVTAEHQLEEFCRQISRQFKTSKAKYEDWSDAFWAVGERLGAGKTLLFFDELSWMGSCDSTFLGKIKSFWDNHISKNSELLFVVCSSASAWLEKNLLSSTGFVGRISMVLKLEELPIHDCNEFWPRNISAYEKFKILAVTGGIPKYLQEVNTKKPAEENIKRLCFTEGEFLVDEFDRIFSDLFLRDSQFYKKIVYALVNGAKEPAIIQAEIIKESESEHLGRMSEYLWELEEAGFIRRDYTWDIKSGKDSRLSKYRLHDNYLRFYLRYIEKNRAQIKRHAYTFKSLTMLQEWNTIMGFQFENLILNNRKYLYKVLKINPDEIVTENPFFQRKSARAKGCQVDYMIQTRFGSLYICEIKFLKNMIDKSIIDEVQNKINSLKYPKGYSCRPVLIHVNGVNEDVIESDYFYKIIDMSELFNRD